MEVVFWYRGMDEYSEAADAAGAEYGNSKIWRQMKSGQKE